VLASIALAAADETYIGAVFLTLSPYAALLLVVALVQAHGRGPASRRAALATSVALLGLTAFLYLPVIVQGGGCFSSLVFLLAILLPPSVPILFGIAHIFVRAEQ
jgi:hypothetical protein